MADTKTKKPEEPEQLDSPKTEEGNSEISKIDSEVLQNIPVTVSVEVVELL